MGGEVIVAIAATLDRDHVVGDDRQVESWRKIEVRGVFGAFHER